MITAPSYNLKGELGEKVTLPAALFESKAPATLLAQAVRVFLSNQRKGQAKTKTRSYVSKTTAKMYRQKGTGRARHGSYSAPIFVGGGIAHGPTGTQNYTLKLSENMKRVALTGALSEKAKTKEVLVLSGNVTGKTKEAAALLKKAEMTDKTILFVVGSKEKDAVRAWRNLEKVHIAQVSQLNPYIILKHNQLIMTSTAMEEAKKLYVA